MRSLFDLTEGIPAMTKLDRTIALPPLLPFRASSVVARGTKGVPASRSTPAAVSGIEAPVLSAGTDRESAAAEAIGSTVVRNALPPTTGTGGHDAPAQVVDLRADAARAPTAATLRSAVDVVGAQVAGVLAQLCGSAEVSPATLDVRAQALEDDAFAVLELLTPAKVGDAEQALDAWLQGIEQRIAAGAPVEAMEYLTILHAVKQGLLEHHPAMNDVAARLTSNLKQIDRVLVQRDRTIEEILKQGLPAAVVREQSSDAKKIHEALFAPAAQNLPYALGRLLGFASDAPGGRVAAGLLAGALFTGVGAQVVGGALQGYVIGSLVERGIHEFAAHASPGSLKRAKELLARFGPLGESVYRWLEATRFSHSEIHHASYAQNYVDQFGPRATGGDLDQRAAQRAKNRARLDAKIDERPAAEAARIRESGYGVSLAKAWRNALFIAPAAAVTSLLTTAVAGSAGITLGAPFVAASTLASLALVPASKSMHPYLHMTRAEAMEKAGPLMRRFLQTDYVRYIARAHYMHHKDSRVNQNLVPGADYLSGFHGASVEAIVELRKMGTFY
jgi:hypothetical protein